MDVQVLARWSVYAGWGWEECSARPCELMSGKLIPTPSIHNSLLFQDTGLDLRRWWCGVAEGKIWAQGGAGEDGTNESKVI